MRYYDIFFSIQGFVLFSYMLLNEIVVGISISIVYMLKHDSLKLDSPSFFNLPIRL